MGAYIFFYLTRAESCSLPASLRSVGDGAFQTCTALSDCVLPEGLTYIGEAAFNGCRALPAVSIPAGVRDLPKQCFYNCTSLSSIEIPGTVESVGQSAFYGCTGVTSIVLNEGVERIGITAFGNSDIEEVHIPASVTDLSPDAFKGAAGFSAYSVSPENPNYAERDGVLYDKHFTAVLRCPDGKGGFHALPDSCEVISDNAFEYCPSVTGVSIPQSVSYIGYNAFAGSGITGLYVPESVRFLGAGCFEDCMDLTEAVIDASVDGLPNYCIRGCEQLRTVTLGPLIQRYGVGCFGYCSSLESVTVPYKLEELPEDCFYACSSLETLSLPAHLRTIGAHAFAECTALEEMDIPDTVSSIGSGAFSGCPALTAVTFLCRPLPASAISWGVFSGSPNVEVHYPNVYPDWAELRPFDSAYYTGVYVPDAVGCAVEFLRADLRPRRTEDGKRDLRFFFRITPMDGVRVDSRRVVLTNTETGETRTVGCYKLFPSALNEGTVFSAVVCGIDESGFDAVYTARAYIEMSGAFTGEGYSLLTGASVNGASGGRERAER